MGFLTTALVFFFSRSGYASLLVTGSCSELHLTPNFSGDGACALVNIDLVEMSNVILITKLRPCVGWKSCLGISCNKTR